MNLDERLHEGWEPEINPTIVGVKNHQHRIREVFQNGVVGFTCTRQLEDGICGKTLASVAMIEGRLRFKIMLQGTEDRRRKPKILVERDRRSTSHDRSNHITVANWDYEQAGQYSKEPQADWQDIEDNLGGKCPNRKCQLVHCFLYEEIARALGFTDCEAALRVLLKRNYELSSNPRNLAAGMLQNYVHRKDGIMRGDIERILLAFQQKESEWIDEEDPFA